MPHLSRIGNSLGVRIPKAIILQLGFREDTDLTFKVTNEGLLIAPVRHAREGWEEAFKAKTKHSKKRPLMGEDFTNKFDEDEWKW